MNRKTLIKDYKPSRYSYLRKALILDSDKVKLVIKKTNKDLNELFTYLNNRNFEYIPDIISNSNNELIYKYFKEEYIPNEQKYEELMHIIINLHTNTQYFKKTTIDNYDEIKENIINNIYDLKNYYQALFMKILRKEYPSPSEYLYARSFHKIKSLFSFLDNEVIKWYELVKNNAEEKVCILHGNLKLEHFIYKKDHPYLISWDKYHIDTPILDIVNLYHNEWDKTNFEHLLDYCFKYNELNNAEKMLLFILISIPWKLDIYSSEMENTLNIKKLIRYIYKTEELIIPYYSEKEVEKS